MRSSSLFSHRMARPLWLAVAVLSAGCSQEAAMREKPVRIIDNDPSLSFVNLVSVDGIPVGAAVGASRGGCCVKLPRAWREGVTVDVAWQRCAPRHDPATLMIVDTACATWRMAVPVPRYPALEWRFHIHLLPGDQAAAIVSDRAPGDPDYPGPQLQEKDYYAALQRFETQARKRLDEQREWERAVELKRAEHRGEAPDSSRGQPW